MEHDGGVLSVRFLVDADPEEIGEALARALLQGRPPTLPPTPAVPALCAPCGLQLPEPISAEWRGRIQSMPVQMRPDNCLDHGKTFAQNSFSLGLRPLSDKDSVEPIPELGGFRVVTSTGYAADCVTIENRFPGLRHFHTCLSSQSIVDTICGSWHHSAEGTWTWRNSLDSVDIRSWIALRSAVWAGKGGGAVLLRELLPGSLLERAAMLLPTPEGVPEHPTVFMLRTVSFMLEMEARAFLECLGFQVVEVWRGARSTEEWAASGNLLTAGSYSLTVGHAALSPREREEGPSFDLRLAQLLSEELPKDPRILDRLDHRPEFVEGNVQVMSFANILDRVCRRAHEDADIFRSFVDLGSGPGLAVLTAHCLFPFRSCVGVELQGACVRTARELARAYQDGWLSSRARTRTNANDLFLKGDMLRDLDWSDASVVFANAVTWPKSVIRSVAHQALLLPKGAVFLLAGRQFPALQELMDGFEVRGDAVLMSFSTDAVIVWVYLRR